MPVWHEATAKWVKEGKLSLLGVTQEQHADRGRLFAQWKRFDWPILNDPINLLESKAVPIFVAIDEHGIVRQVGPKLDRLEKEFLDKKFEDDAPPSIDSASRPELSELRTRAEVNDTGDAWLRYGDALALWGGESRASDAIEAYITPCNSTQRTAWLTFGLVSAFDDVLSPTAGSRGISRKQSMRGAGRSNSIPISTSGGGESSSTARGSISRTRFTTGSAMPPTTSRHAVNDRSSWP